MQSSGFGYTRLERYSKYCHFWSVYKTLRARATQVHAPTHTDSIKTDKVLNNLLEIKHLEKLFEEINSEIIIFNYLNREY